ncbi:MAG: hypothetical protein KAG82_09555 [Alcanivoracaceae bacterium]|nr:hypothetical protein [Alcanivoracaceae bacterium]
MKRYASLILAVFLLGGCASAAKVEYMVYEAEEGAVSYSEVLIGNVSVRNVSGGKKTNPMLTAKISNDAFIEALEKTLSNEGLLSSDGQYQIDANILEVSSPMVGLDMSATTRIHYILSDKSSQTLILDKTLSTTKTAKPGDAIVAAVRQRKSVEMSGKENIKEFLQVLSEIDFSADAGAAEK